MAERRQKIIDEREAAKRIKDGMVVCFGGYVINAHPMAIIRQVIRNGVKDLTLVGAGEAGLEVDLLIGAGCVKKVIATFVSGDRLVPIGPFYRAMAQRGEIEVGEVTDAHLYSGLTAAAYRVPYLPCRSGVGTSYPEINPDLKVYQDPIKGEMLIAVPAIDLDVAVLHAAYSDPYGNVQYEGPIWSDHLIWQAADKTIVQVEKVISNEEIRRRPERTLMWNVDAIVRAPYGAHPFASSNFYLPDEEHIREYVEAANAYLRRNDRGPFEAYLEKYIYKPETHADYLEVIGIKRLLSLYEW